MIKKILIFHLFISAVIFVVGKFFNAPLNFSYFAVSSMVSLSQITLLILFYKSIFFKKSIAFAPIIIVSKYAILGIVFYYAYINKILINLSVLLGLICILPTILYITVDIKKMKSGKEE